MKEDLLQEGKAGPHRRELEGTAIEQGRNQSRDYQLINKQEEGRRVHLM
jgi:hypothetical protein